MGDRRRRRISSLLSRNGRKQKETFLLENGSMLLQDRFASCNGICTPSRSFSSEDLKVATNKFNESQIIYQGLWCSMYKGFFKDLPVLIKMIHETSLICFPLHPIRLTHDLAVSSQLSNHKNILKLLGYCLELQMPAAVYEYEGCELLSDMLYNKMKDEDNHQICKSSFTWKNRVKIAKNIANALTYLHTAFSTPIIYGNLSHKKVVVDRNGVAKLFDFSMSITLPAGELHVEGVGVGCMRGFMDPEYQQTGIVSTKLDVYDFGMLLIVLFTGQQFVCGSAGNLCYINEHGKTYIREDHLQGIVDPMILAEEWETSQTTKQHLQDFLALALRCVHRRREARPEMIEVAKELRLMERAVSSHIPKT